MSQKKYNIKKRIFKKWTTNEEIKILEYIAEQGCFEKPTAQVYYNNMIASIDIDATWDLVKWKVRNLKRLYLKAAMWKKSAELVDGEDSNTIKKNVLKMCPHFNILAEIFGRKGKHSRDACETPPQIKFNDSLIDDILRDEGEGEENSEDDVTAMPLEASTPAAKTLTPSADSSKIAQRKLDIEERKLSLEEFKIKRELELKEKQMVQDFEIRKLQLAKDERISKYEIDVKYKLMKDKKIK